MQELKAAIASMSRMEDICSHGSHCRQALNTGIVCKAGFSGRHCRSGSLSRHVIHCRHGRHLGQSLQAWQ
jgi:hypothetical protein